MPDVTERLRILVQRKREGLILLDQERNHLKQEITELEACLAPGEPTQTVLGKDKASRVNWTEQEDDRLFSFIEKNPDLSLSATSRDAGKELGRSPKSVLARINYFKRTKQVKSRIVKDPSMHRGRKAILEVIR